MGKSALDGHLFGLDASGVVGGGVQHDPGESVRPAGHVLRLPVVPVGAKVCEEAGGAMCVSVRAESGAGWCSRSRIEVKDVRRDPGLGPGPGRRGERQQRTEDDGR